MVRWRWCGGDGDACVLGACQHKYITTAFKCARNFNHDGKFYSRHLCQGLGSPGSIIAFFPTVNHSEKDRSAGHQHTCSVAPCAQNPIKTVIVNSDTWSALLHPSVTLVLATSQALAAPVWRRRRVLQLAEVRTRQHLRPDCLNIVHRDHI